MLTIRYKLPYVVHDCVIMYLKIHDSQSRYSRSSLQFISFIYWLPTKAINHSPDIQLNGDGEAIDPYHS